jgi:hypothetical protein
VYIYMYIYLYVPGEKRNRRRSEYFIRFCEEKQQYRRAKQEKTEYFVNFDPGVRSFLGTKSLRGK